MEESLVAVVSLPAGVFNPYSGVKTSILILDKALAKQSTTIAFFKVENDGFGLGAQRREIGKNDLPQARAEIAEYLRRLRAGEPVDEFAPTLGLVVPKEKIAGNGDYNLSGDRYREGVASNHLFAQVELGTICKPEYGFTASAEDKGDARFVRITDIAPDGRIRKDEPKFIKLSDESKPYLLKNGDLLVARTGATFGKTMLFDEEYPAVFASYLIRLRFPQDSLLPEFYWSFAQSEKYWEQARNLATGGGQPQFNGNALNQIKIPLPPLEVQKEIVAEIKGYQKVIDGARAVLDNYRPHIPIHPDWPVVELGELCQAIVTGPFGSALHQSDYVEVGIPVINPRNIVDGTISTDGVKMVSPATRDRLKEFTVREGDIVIARRGEMGRCGVVTAEMNGWLCGTGSFVIRLNQDCLARFVFFQVASPKVRQYLEEQAVGVTMKNLNQGVLASILIPHPPLATQQAIVAEIEAEQALVAANQELITRFEQKIQATVARVWGEETGGSPK